MMDIHFYREARYGDLVIYAAVHEQYLLGKHFTKDGTDEGVSWVLPDYKGRYKSTLAQWQQDVLSYRSDNIG